MASRTITQVTDDLDGSEGAETVTFGLHGAMYEVDLTKDNQQKLQEALKPFLSVARKAGGGGPRRAAGRGTGSGAPSGGSGVDAKAVRSWAAENSIELSARGRIPGTIVEQYRAAHPS
jgi:hypothetical protein